MFVFKIGELQRLNVVIAVSLFSGLGNEARCQTVEARGAALTVLTGSERERFLRAHNVAREKVGVAPVEWSNDLSEQALGSLRKQRDALIAAAEKGWKEGLAVLPEHSVDTEYGENIAGWVGRRNQSAEFAVELWLREKAAFDKLNENGDYRVGDEEGQLETDDLGKERSIVVGHYTAIVWKATKRIGSAKLSFDLADEKGTTRRYEAILCNYSPAGNRRGEKPF